MLEFKLNRVRGYVKERLELTPMGSFNVEQGGIKSGPGSHGIPEGVQTDDLASACVLCPLNHPVLDFEMGGLAG